MIRPVPPLIAAAAVAAVAALGPASAHAADPGRWFQTAVTETKAEYDRGMTSDDDGHLYFAGLPRGGYRTDLELVEQLAVDPLLPADLTAAEGDVRIGDWTFTGGRLIAPLACDAPQPGGDPCGRGAFGIVSPDLGWIGRVPLDPADVAKPTWAEASPDGSLVWTSSGPDLIAYATADVQPGDAPIRPVRRLAGAVPPSGISGATFVDDRLFVAGQAQGFQVWSIDLETGEPVLEIERPWTGASEGMATVDALGGELHWQVMPSDPQGREPTFGEGHGTIVSFVSREDAFIQIKVRPRRVRAGERKRVRVLTYLTYAGVDHPFGGVTVAPARRRDGRPVVTRDNGKATMTITAKRPGRIRLQGTKPPIHGGWATLRAVR